MCSSDVEMEWRRLLTQTEVPEVISDIQHKIETLQQQSRTISQMVASGPPLITTTSVSPSTVSEFSSITNFAWDQTDKHVKVYVTVPAVHETAENKVDVIFGDQTVEVKVRTATKNYRLLVKKLNYPIKPSECSYRIKTDCVSLTLIKKSPSHWSDLGFKDAKAGATKKQPTPPAAAGGDPGGSIMNLFKDLYDQGDDDMKRTIAKAWTEANDKKKQGGGGVDKMYDNNIDLMKDM
eukprot:GHVS01027144.1.p1 GENE.GHVS01027144.1~~GHVS01027144.1.p1  ORF type:complete len:236 (-),score=36.18 GHVS01027144.1:92-799(-)